MLDGSCTDVQAFFLNTDFMGVRVAANRSFKALPAREAFNQDASVVFVCAALNMVCSNAYIQGRLSCDS